MVACKALPTNENIAVDLVCRDRVFFYTENVMEGDGNVFVF